MTEQALSYTEKSSLKQSRYATESFKIDKLSTNTGTDRLIDDRCFNAGHALTCSVHVFTKNLIKSNFYDTKKASQAHLRTRPNINTTNSP
jgi:hypothetical protein